MDDQDVLLFTFMAIMMALGFAFIKLEPLYYSRKEEAEKKRNQSVREADSGE